MSLTSFYATSTFFFAKLMTPAWKCRKKSAQTSAKSTLSLLRTRHPDFLPRRGENLPRRGKKLPRLPGKTTTPINSNLNPQKTKLMGDETETAAASAFMLEAENGGHNAWWQPLNNHWTSIEQTLNKPCSSPSNEVCGACQTTHEYEKRKSDREIERRHYLDEMLPLF